MPHLRRYPVGKALKCQLYLPLEARVATAAGIVFRTDPTNINPSPVNRAPTLR